MRRPMNPVVTSNARTSTRRAGLTVVELLVVIAVVAILFGILVPAVLSARNAGRRSQCANNLRQLGAAVQQFHERNGSLPAYWGAMKFRPGEPFGGWLLHILPDLGEQVFFDSLPIPGRDGAKIETFIEITGTTVIAPPVEESTDPKFFEGIWVTSTVGQVQMVGGPVDIVKSELVGRVGTPGRGPIFDRTRVITGTAENTLGLPDDFARKQKAKSLDVLQCSDDVSTPPHWMQPGRDNEPWSLTNYMANAHVFMKFRGPRMFGISGQGYGISTMGGRFPQASAMGDIAWGTILWDHEISLNGGTNTLLSAGMSNKGGLGVSPRQFAHIIDGLSNTIMFGEGMRRCDANPGSVRGTTGRFRFAFLPSATNPPGEEHAFGIDPAVSGSTTNLSRNSFVPGGGLNVGFGGYGNTIMFQQRPAPDACSHFRLQANHDVLNVVMCDGSVRGISPRVSRREQTDPDVAGRRFGGNDRTYTSDGLGGVVGIGIFDGIWDMLMVPADPVGNVLPNTGEVGKEK